MKKIFLVMILAAFGAAGAFAQPKFGFSAGFGEYITSDFGGGLRLSYPGIEAHVKTPYFGTGIFGFFDATFIEANMGFFTTYGRWEQYVLGVGTYEVDMNDIGMDIGLMVKYPFSVTEKLAIFPLLGITYRAILLMEIDEERQDFPEDYSALWYKVGSGIDISFTDTIYLRVGIAYGWRDKNRFEKDARDALRELTSGQAKVEIRPGHGLEIKCAMGFRFK
jgi:hypothetical protein